MSVERNLSLTDRQRVDDALLRISARANRTTTLGELLDEWRRFVISVRQGYGWSMDSYNRDLAVRDFIEEISESLSMEGRRVVEDAIRNVDSEFIEATWDPQQPDKWGPPQFEIGWWQFRVPKNPKGKLLRELEKMGFIYCEP